MGGLRKAAQPSSNSMYTISQSGGTSMLSNIKAMFLNLHEVLTSSSSSPPEPSPFLSLPAELRNRIYEYVYPSGQTIHPYAKQQIEACQKQTRTQPSYLPPLPQPQIPPNDIEHYLALTCVNQQIRSEVLPILISNTTFIFYHPCQEETSSEFTYRDIFFKTKASVVSNHPFQAWLPSLGRHVKHLRHLRIMVRRSCDAPYGHPCQPGFSAVDIDFGTSEVVADGDEKGDGGGQYCRYVKIELEGLRRIIGFANRPGMGAGVSAKSAKVIWDVFVR